MRTGLRTEIILSISLLLAAALLFAGFLLLKLTEQNLLEQQRTHSARIMRLVVASLDEPSRAIDYDLELAISRMDRLQTVLGQQTGIGGWRLLDVRLQPIASVADEMTNDFPTLSPLLLSQGELYEELSYQSNWLVGEKFSHNYLDLTMSIWSNGEAQGLLQIRFSLDGLRQRVQQAQRLMMAYVVLYGLVLAVFAVYLLNRKVVKPIRQLHSATATVAEGTLSPVTVPAGPGEIHELANSFNRMVAALADSRMETEEHIASLEGTNRALAQARDDLIRSEKLATVGHLAAGMAHEIGNPLGAIIGYLNVLISDLEGDGPRDLVERSLTEVGRIDKLVRELLDYSSPGSHRVEIFNPVALLQETVEMLRHQGLYDGIEVVDHCASDNGSLSMDRARLMQVWINLLLNARDAMNGEGLVELSSRHDDETLTVMVKDHGGGVPPEITNRIFEPFYTTKGPGKGYGLGLAVCQRIVAEQNGRIEVISGPGLGTTFSVTLPCCEEPS